MPKLDLKKEYREFYNPSARQCSLVDVPEMQFLMVDGSGDPNTSDAYQDAIGTLCGGPRTWPISQAKTSQRGSGPR
jgi:hypothetical protein